MAIYITVDGGTTNTRLYLVKDGCVLDSLKLGDGVKSGTAALKAALSEGITEILEKNSLVQTDISQILASGMITSEYGLVSLSHICLPAGKRELHDSIFSTAFEDVTSIPWSFIRGVKRDNGILDDTDMMRGEETEIVGIVNGSGEDSLYILPGSHSKHIRVDKNENITDIRTMLSGELFAAVMEHTILKDAADFEHNTIVDQKLIQGCEYARLHGVNEAMFKTRILKNLFNASKEDCYSFLMGAVLCAEVDAIVDASENNVIIGGQKQLKNALSILLQHYSDKNIITLSKEAVDCSTAIGAVRIFEYSK